MSVRDRVTGILQEVVPSTYGDARFAALAPGYTPETFGPGTTCGYLPCYVGHQLGVRDGITRCGVDGVRQIARSKGVWIDAGGRRRPRLGDFYGLSQTRGGILTHVGVIVDASRSTWRTADAGQGTHDVQQALFVERPYDAGAVTLGGPLGPRPLAGWLDLGAYFGEPPETETGPVSALLLLAAVGALAWALLEA